MIDRVRAGVGLVIVSAFVAVSAGLVGVVSCGSAPTAFLISGPGGAGNEPPRLTILTPAGDITVPQGAPFLIEWDDADRDDNAKITFELVEVLTNRVVILVEDIDENDQPGGDSHAASTGLIPVGVYNLLGIITDGVNPAVTAVAMVSNAGTTTTQRAVVRIVGPNEGPQSLPPTVAVTQPQFDRSVTQDDQVTIVVQPTLADPNANSPFDGDSPVTLFILLDTDLDPDNDDPFNPGASIIVLQRQTVAQDSADAIPFNVLINLNSIPARPNGEPYFVRATVTDGTNPPVHSYSRGTISVVELASGVVDLFDVGRRVSGAKIYGFNPNAQLGSTVKSVGDFDADGLADFMIVARFGNPQNVGPVGEAYLLYGQDRIRFGGNISANSVSQTVSGVVFQAPPVRTISLPRFAQIARTDGIADIDIVQDLTDDGRPELLFGLPHVHGAFDATDYDPADEQPQGFPPFGCYPDFLINNCTDTQTSPPCDNFAGDVGWFAGGMAVIVNSQNRDDEGIINANRLEATAVSLELTGSPRFVLDTNGASPSGSILPRADNETVGDGQLGNDPQEPGRISGGRLIAGGYDYILENDLPREDLWGTNVSSIGDQTSDGLNEIVISSPRNERHLLDLRNSTPIGFFNSQLESTFHVGSITVFPGQNYNLVIVRDRNDETGMSITPFLDHHVFPPFGKCSNPPEGRGVVLRAETYDIFAEDVDDFLGGGKSAGDVNQDGLDDLLCSAPLNDRASSLPDSGAVYIIYSRPIFGEIHLDRANDPVLRPPMLRVRGVKRGDQVGFKQAAGLDVNGDRIDDVFLSSPRADVGAVARDSCIGDFNGDGLANASDLALASFSDCQVRFGATVFSSDACKAFDYDNDADIDADDRCVFCCLSGACSVDDECIFGREAGNCCANMADNGFVGVIFGGRFIDGDRDITQMASSDLPGVVFFGGSARDLAGWDVSSAGDYNQDGFGDLLIAVPGEVRRDSAGRERLGVVYLVFGGTHLVNTIWNLSSPDRGVGTEFLPGIVFFSPYVKGRPNEAAPTTVGFIGDINNDGFGDIAIGNQRADFIDLTFPQGPNAPGDDPSAGRRTDAGDVYVIYGNNFGTNRATP